LSIEKYEVERARHFDATNSTVENFDDFEEELADLFPEGVSPESLILMAGAPTGSILTLSSVAKKLIPPGEDDPKHKDEITPPGLLVKVVNDDYLSEPNYVTIYKESSLGRGIYINLVMFQKNVVKAAGGLMIKTILLGIESLGKGKKSFKRLRLMAAGGRIWGDMKKGGRWSGYKAWPQYGFDMKLGEVTVEMFPLFKKYPKNLTSCDSVSGLLALSGGADFWAVVGDGYYMTFELGTSASRKRLEVELNRRFP
jgi:hypothetical protein